MQEIKEILHEKLLNTSNAILEGRTNYVLYDIEDTLSMLAQLEQMTPLGLGECLGLVTGAYAMLSDSCEIHDISSPSNRQRPQMVQGTKGAPKFEIPISVLESLLDSDFTVKDISYILNVSEKTIKRRFVQYGLSSRQRYSSIPDIELDSMVEDIVAEFPYVGYRTVRGILVSKGVKVQEQCCIG